MPTLRETFYSDCMGYLDLRAIKNKKVKRETFMLDDERGIKAFIKQHIKDHDLYFGVATRDADGGKKENIVEIPGLWVDIDFKDIDQHQAEKLLSDFPHKPTVIVESGGGLHLYWVFREPCNKDDIDQCEAVMRGLAMRLGGDLASTDASRILRIPGTRNQKYSPSRPVNLRYHNGARYSLSDFEDFVVESQANTQAPIARSTDNLNSIMACKFMAHCRDDAASLKEPEWYAMVTILAREPGGVALIHELSRPHKGYKKGHTDSKIMHALNDSGPMTCESIRLKCGFDCGISCNVKSPAALPFLKATETTYATETTETTSSPETTRNYQKLPENYQDPTKRNVRQEVKDWLDTCDGTFSIRDVSAEFSAQVGSPLYKNIKDILSKLNKESLIERIGSARGIYRKVVSELEEMDWWNISNEEYPLAMPLGLEGLAKLMPKSIVVISGEQNSSKTALTLNIAKDNCKTHRTHYFNSEMSGEELRDRITKFDDVSPEHFRNVHFYPRVDNFQDVIFPDDLNIIDFLEVHDEFWRIGGIFRAIHDKLAQGCAVVNIQKSKGAELGRGGSMSIEKARLYLSVSTLFDRGGKPYNQCKIMKAKLYRNHERNPNGMVRDFRVYGGAKILPLSDWEYPKK